MTELSEQIDVRCSRGSVRPTAAASPRRLLSFEILAFTSLAAEEYAKALAKSESFGDRRIQRVPTMHATSPSSRQEALC